MLKPAAMAWPPNLMISPGLRASTAAKASRKWNPAILRHDPLSVSASPWANTNAGRCHFSLIREATMPTTPWCQSGWYKHTHLGITLSWLASRRVKILLACCCISASILRLWALRSSNSWASWLAICSLSLNKHSMPKLMSSSLPAALSRGPTLKPKSEACRLWCWRFATFNKANKPGLTLPARMRANPWATRIRLLCSIGTRSATVPRATKSRYWAMLGGAICCWANHPCVCNWRRKADIT